MSEAHAPDADTYYVPHGSPWPIYGSVTLFTLMAGAIATLNSWLPVWSLVPGFVMLASLFIFWFGTVIRESEQGYYNHAVDRSFRLGMMWFIFSEIMFFAAFFGALFYARSLVMPWLSGEGTKFFTNLLLWHDYRGGWPTNGPAALGPGAGGKFETVSPIGLPAINTALLLSSSVTVTIAHHALITGHRARLATFLALTFLLGFTFVGLQAVEYHEAYTELGLQLGTGIYGSTFFMLTGFHGLHVTVGAIILTVIWFRVMKGQLTPQRHFAFQAAAWYWHFVDIVWLGLFIFVYWL
jgi:cytochrome c oxidase subunit 3